MSTIARVCQYCQAEFRLEFKRRNIEGRGIYCSRSCRSKSQPKKFTGSEEGCPVCTKTFYTRKSRLERSKSGLVFCSVDCKNVAAQLDGIEAIHPSHYGSSEKYRSLALRKLPNLCVTCGFSEDISMLDVDHINSIRSDNSLGNLQILCVWCHALKTRKRPRSEPTPLSGQ